MGVRVDGYGGYSLTAFKKGVACPQGLGGWVTGLPVHLPVGFVAPLEPLRKQVHRTHPPIHPHTQVHCGKLLPMFAAPTKICYLSVSLYRWLLVTMAACSENAFLRQFFPHISVTMAALLKLHVWVPVEKIL